MSDPTHSTYKDFDGDDLCWICGANSDEDLALKCGDKAGQKRNLERARKEFMETLEDAAISCAMNGLNELRPDLVHPKLTRKQAVKLKQLMKERFKRATGLNWSAA